MASAPALPISHAREFAVPRTREERVKACMALMPASWVRGVTARRLAEEWGVGLNVVEQASAEAWRRINAQDVNWVREHTCRELLRALKDAKTIADLKDRVAAVVKVVEAWAPLVGAAAPARVALEGTVRVEHAVAPPWAAGSLAWEVVAAMVADEPGALEGKREALAALDRMVAPARAEVADDADEKGGA